MDDKTVIVRPKPVEPKENTPAQNLDTKPKGRKAKAEKPEITTATPAAKKPSNLPIIILGLCAVLLIGFGSSLTSIYILSRSHSTDGQFTPQELSAELVPVANADSEAEDEALVKAAIEPRIVNLSGDPLIIRQLSNAPRQIVKLGRDPQKKAAGELGLTGDVFRVKDVLDAPGSGLQVGLAGSQDDIAALSEFEPPPSSDPSIGFSAVEANVAGDQQFHEFAQNIKAKASISETLLGLGIGDHSSASVEAAFVKFYGQSQLNKGNKLAVRTIADPENSNAVVPVQVSIYRQDDLVGSIALDDLDHYARAADPWVDQDIFSTQLLPQETKPEDRPRLLDAIYAAALRNKLPTAVTGEAIMLLSRAQDLEQKTQDGDTITIIYSPTARDPKTGLGRIVYINIGRSAGNMECFAFQAQAGAKFDCISATGESNFPDNGMVLPVNGVIAAKFGPQQAAGDGAKENMNFGVDWTAPEGTDVVAAYDGEVLSVGQEGSWDTVIRLSHADNKATMYAYLQRVAAGITIGSKIKAGQVIGSVGKPLSSREARLHFELRENDVPVDPMPEVQASAGAVGGGGIVDQFVHRIITIESANRCNAANPLSTAVGLGQFIESTWMTTVRIHRPDLIAGRTRRQILDMRLDCNLSRAMTTAFTRDNAAVLRRSGAPVTPGNLYLAHFLGVGGAVKSLVGSPSRPIADVFGTAHVRANPFESGKSIGYLVSWAAKKMGSKAAVAPAPTAQADSGKAAKPNQITDAAPLDLKPTPATTPVAAALTRYDSNPAFTKLKNAVVAFLQ